MTAARFMTAAYDEGRAEAPMLGLAAVSVALQRGTTRDALELVPARLRHAVRPTR